MNLSYWEKTSFFKQADYTIVGAGIVGLFTALELKNKQPEANVLVLERSYLPNGASTKNAGFACFGSLSELIAQLKKSSEKDLVELVSKRWEGLQKLKSTLGAQQIELENNGGYELFSDQDEELWKECISKMEYFNNLLREVIPGDEDIYQMCDEKISDFKFKNVEHLIFNPYEAQIHSGKMMESLINKCQQIGVKILNGFEVVGYKKNQNYIEIEINNQQSSKISLLTNKLLICNNAFVNKLIPGIDVKPGRGQVFITKPIDSLNIKGTFHYEEGYYYFRNIDNRILIGGGRNLDFEKESTSEFGITNKVKNRITDLLNKVILPEVKWEFDMEWSGIMAFGSELKPIVKEYDRNVYCAVRCNGMGVAIGSKIAEELAVIATN